MLKGQLKYPFDFIDAYLTNDTFFLIAFATSDFRSLKWAQQKIVDQQSFVRRVQGAKPFAIKFVPNQNLGLTWFVCPTSQ